MIEHKQKAVFRFERKYNWMLDSQMNLWKKI